MNFLTCENLCLGYENQVVADHLNFSVDYGDYLCIVGENGSGKTTLIKTLLGFVRPLSGSVAWNGGRQPAIGYLPQQTAAQKDFPASVYEVVLSGCVGRLGFRPFYSRKEKSLALQNLERLNILSLRNDCYRELSGGQQQRVLLARALCAASDLLILDEPVTGLDPAATSDLYRLIEQLNREDGLTILMVSHDIRCAVEQARTVLHMGAHSFFGSTDDYLKSDLAREFLGGAHHAHIYH